MVDVKQVAIAVDSSQIVRAETALKAAEQAGRRTSASVSQLETASQRAAGSLGGLNRSAQQSAASTRAAQQGAAQLGRSVDSLDRSYDQAAASAGAFQRATASASSGLGLASRHAKSYEAQAANASRHTANLGAQFNDIGVQLAAGTSPLLLAVQQGTQINQVMDQLGRGTGRVRTLAAAFTSIISPMSLATIGIIAGGAALAQWGLKAASAKIETRSLAELTDDLADSVQTYQDAADSVLMSIDDQADAYGSLAGEMREVNRIQAELAQGAAQQTLDRLTASIGTATQGGMLQRALAANPMTDVMTAFTGRDAIQRFFEIPAETTSRVEALLGGFRQMNEALQSAKGNSLEQNRIMRQMLPIAKSLAEEFGKGDTAQQRISKSQRAFLDSLAQAADQSARIVATNEEIVVTASKRAQLSERDSRWAEQTLARMEAQAAASQTIADHGANSAAVMNQQLAAQQEALATELKRRGITGELAENLQAALVAQQNANVAAEERQRYDREAQRLAQEREQSAKRELQLAVQRQHAEAQIAQRLQNRIEVARAIVVHGKDSVQAKLAEEAVSRRLFELDLDRHGITGDIRQQLIGQYEAAAQLESQIVQAQPAFQGLQQTIAGISNAWGEFVVSGFRDFKDFTRQVLDQFKRLLVQMIATAAKNRIMFSMGMGGIGGAPMGGGGGGLLGGLLGGGGGGGGGLLSGIGKLFGGGGGSGGGLFGGLTSGPFGGGLKNAAFNLGLIHGPAIAGGGAAALASGAATSAAFGFGPAAGIGAGGLTAGGGAMAATGVTALGAAVPILAGAAILFAGLRSKTKIIDEGLRVTVDAADVLVENFTKVEKSRFFGLSKRRSTRTGMADEETAAPIRDAVTTMREQMQAAADVLNLGSNAITRWTGQVDISLKDLSEGDHAAKIQEALAGVRDEMAQLALTTAGLEAPLEGAGEKLMGLAQSLVGVNEILGAVGQHQMFSEGVEGAQGAQALADRFGGLDVFQQRAQEFFDLFFTEAERMAHLQAQLTQAFGELNIAMPETMLGFRELAQAQDLTTEAGREMYAALLQLAPQFAELEQYEQQLAQTRISSQSRVQAKVTEAIQAIEQIAEAATSTAQSGADAAMAAASAAQSAASAAVAAANSARQAAASAAAATRSASSASAAASLAAVRATGDAEAIARVEATISSTSDAYKQYYDAFVPESERMADLTSEMTAALSEFGATLPDSREAFRDLVEAQDIATESGQNLYAALIALAPEFDQVVQYEQRLADERQAIAEQQAAAQQRAAQQQIAAQERAAQQQQRSLEQRASFEARIQGMVHGLTDTPREALARRRDAFIEEARKLGAATDAIHEWYAIEAQNIATKEAEERQRIAKKAADERRRIAEREASERIRLQQQQAQALEQFHRQFLTQAEYVTLVTERLVRAGVATTAEGFRAQVQMPGITAADRHRLLAHSRDVLTLQQYEDQLAAQRRKAAEEAARQAEQARQEAARQREALRQQREAEYRSFYESFYSQAERQADARRELAAEFAGLGLALPRTRREFRGLVEETRPGSALFHSLVGLADRFRFITEEANELNETLGYSQQFFRDVREEAFVRSAQGMAVGPGGGGGAGGVAGLQANSILGEILQAIREGNFDTVRELRDLREEEERAALEPDMQVVNI